MPRTAGAGLQRPPPGRPALLLHLYTGIPVRAGFVLPPPIRHRTGRELGTVLAPEVPVLAGGLGSITRLKLKLGRTYRFHGRRRSYLSAACAAPDGFRSAFFRFVRRTFAFRGGKRGQRLGGGRMPGSRP